MDTIDRQNKNEEDDQILLGIGCVAYDENLNTHTDIQ